MPPVQCEKCGAWNVDFIGLCVECEAPLPGAKEKASVVVPKSVVEDRRADTSWLDEPEADDDCAGLNQDVSLELGYARPPVLTYSTKRSFMKTASVAMLVVCVSVSMLYAKNMLSSYGAAIRKMTIPGEKIAEVPNVKAEIMVLTMDGPLFQLNALYEDEGAIETAEGEEVATEGVGDDNEEYVSITSATTIEFVEAEAVAEVASIAGAVDVLPDSATDIEIQVLGTTVVKKPAPAVAKKPKTTPAVAKTTKPATAVPEKTKPTTKTEVAVNKPESVSGRGSGADAIASMAPAIKPVDTGGRKPVAVETTPVSDIELPPNPGYKVSGDIALPPTPDA